MSKYGKDSVWDANAGSSDPCKGMDWSKYRKSSFWDSCSFERKRAVAQQQDK